MAGMRYRISTLLIGTAWIGFLCLALIKPTPLLAALVVVLTFSALLVSALVVVHRRGSDRAFAIGFLLFAGSQLAMIFLVTGGPDNLSSAFIPPIYEAIHKSDLIGAEEVWRIQRFRQIVNWGSATLFGVLGGTISRILYGATARPNNS